MAEKTRVLFYENSLQMLNAMLELWLKFKISEP